MTDLASATSARTIAACLEGGGRGFTVGNRLSLPFRADLIGIMIGRQRSAVGEPELITDFSSASKRVRVVEQEARTDLYFLKHKSLQDEIGHYRGRLVISCCEKGADIFDQSNHVRLECSIRDDDPMVGISLHEQL